MMRIKVTLILVSLALILSMLPEKKNKFRERHPEKVYREIQKTGWMISADQLAKMIINEDTSLQIIDLRDLEEYRKCNIPGSVNIPFPDLFKPEYEGYLNNKSAKNILYSNDGILASQARTVALRAGFTELYVLKGGLNEWFRTIMYSEFSGTSISAKDNALFEIRYKARRYFTQMNSLPDSMKQTFLKAKKAEEKKLVGGCE